MRSPRSAWRRLTLCFWLPLLSLLAGCEPALEDGFFDCAAGGCPDGYRCLSDNRCHGPSFLGDALYEPCVDGDTCASGTCLRPYDMMTVVGLCSVSDCTTGSCPTVNGLAGACAPGQGCVVQCDSTADCIGDERCLVLPMTEGLTGCLDLVGRAFMGASPCVMPEDCLRGMQCVRAPLLSATGICTWPCSPSGECPSGSTCETLPTTVGMVGMNPPRACLATCNGTPGSCGELSCAPFPGAEPHCAPAGWLP